MGLKRRPRSKARKAASRIGDPAAAVPLVAPRGQADSVWRLWEYARVHKRRILCGCLCGMVVSLIMVGIGEVLKQMQTAMEKGDLLYVHLFAASTFLIFLFKGGFAFGQVYLLSNVTERVAERLRNDLFEHLQTLSLSFFESRKTGSLIATISTDVPVVQQMLTTAMMEGVTAPLVAVGGIGYLLYLDWRLALATLITLPLMGSAIAEAGKRMRRASESIQKSMSDTAAMATETISAIRVVRSFVMEEKEAVRFRAESRRTYYGNMRVVRLNASLKPIVELLGALSIAFILWFGGMEIVRGHMTLPKLMGFLYVANLITSSIQQIGRFKTYMERLRGASTRIFKVLDIKPDIQDAPDAPALAQVHGEITFEDVHFAYEGGEPVLRGVSFAVRPGEALALVGPSGAGKSTIANLIPRFYDVTAGTIRVDGLDIRSVTSRSLRAHIGIVAQEPVLFSGTIRENIAYGRPEASEEDVLAAARAANAHNFITQSLPEGYATVVGERGVKLSGGQRQRIAIARAILKDPRILILDEATSALDTESEALVQEALDKLMQGRTTIIIAHRLSTVRKANRILVLAEGRVQEQGAHADLLRQNGLYARLYEAGLGNGEPRKNGNAAVMSK